MYQWYKQASVCLVYLADVPPSQDPHEADSAFRTSRWFTRGWTLQELLAPSTLVFYDQTWEFIGLGFNKKRRPSEPPVATLAGLITRVTRIPEYYVTGEIFFRRASVAQRMSWASSRTTTRVEDEAYCLLGLFAVNMPLLYGEGRKAFQRLQEEIMRESDDHSLFAWGRRGARGDGGGPAACFARFPSDFAHCEDVYVKRPWFLPRHSTSSHYFMTNRGLLISLPLVMVDSGDALGMLNCSAARGPDDGGDACFAIHLVQVQGDDKTFYRMRPTPPRLVQSDIFEHAPSRSVYITKLSPDGFSIPSGLKLGNITGILKIVNVYPSDWKLLQGQVYWTGNDSGEASQIIYVHCVDRAQTDVVLRIAYEFEVRRGTGERGVDALMDVISSSQPSRLRPTSMTCTADLLQKDVPVMVQLALPLLGTSHWGDRLALDGASNYVFHVDRSNPAEWGIRHQRVQTPVAYSLQET